jgi:Icc-related predicted phosphoesterase
MRIVCVADTHGYHEDLQIPDGDLLIFAGDYAKNDYNEMGQLAKFNEWLGKLPMPVIVIAGNHDWIFEKSHHQAANILANATYLNDSTVMINGLKIWGSPVSPRFLDWAFNRDRGPDIDRHWQMIPDDVDVLITHGPPYGILDMVRMRGTKVRSTGDPHQGCEDLKRRIAQLSRLKLHVCGHLHEGYGREEHNGVQYVNASKGYHPIANPAIVVEMPV